MDNSDPATMSDLIGLTEKERQPNHLALIAFLMDKGFKRVGERLWVFGPFTAHIHYREESQKILSEVSIGEEKKQEILNYFDKSFSNVICCIFDRFPEFSVAREKNSVKVNLTIPWENEITRFGLSEIIYFVKHDNFWQDVVACYERKFLKKDKS